jgi:AcrR family transcriptional regulator
VTGAAPVAADESCERQRAGRHRDPSRDEAILAATLAMFTEQGFAGVSIEGVAARSGVAKATIYRRFPTKVALLVEAIKVGACFTDYLPDTGDVRTDLANMLTKLMDILRSDLGPVLSAFAAERIRYPQLDEEFKRSVIGAKRAHIRYLVAAAIERGDLPRDLDVDVVAEAGPALLWHHALNGLPITDDLPGRIIDVVLPPPPFPAGVDH